MKSRMYVFGLLLSIFLVACGGGGGSSSHRSNTPATFSLSANVSNLTSSGLVLSVNNSTVSVPSGSSMVTLATGLNSGTAYTVSVSSQPTGQICSVTSGTGTITSANVTDVAVTCSAQYYTVGGTVSGLSSSGLVLANGVDTVTLSSGANTFTLPAGLANGNSYAVTVQSQPSDQICAVSSGSGTINNANVTNVSVSCTNQLFSIGGTISGLTQSGLVLANGTDTLTISANATSFTMPTGEAYGAAYNITVRTKPFLQTCTISNGSGTVGSVMSNVQIVCNAGVTLTTLHSFDFLIDGSSPRGSLIQASDGNLYGTTNAWGSGSGTGTVFKITPSGTLTTLHLFTIGGSDGANPYGNLIQASDGNLYGTTYNGGSNGNGTLFRISTSGTLTTLYSFTGGSDGAGPSSSLIQASDGALYGMTIFGSNGYGTVFKITLSGTLTTLHAFAGGSESAHPNGELIQASDGNLYGMTVDGGTNNLGTMFQITPSGTLTTLYSFTGGNDGASPYGSLLQASDGNLYGMTNSGGNGSGTVFKITLSGMLTTLHAFAGGNDGGSPMGSLIQASDGNLYGMTYYGGSDGVGRVFQITPSGTLTTLHAFTGGSDGGSPVGSLIQASNGSLYGMTASGGAYGSGAVFELR